MINYPSNKPKLPIYERLTASVIILFILFLAFLNLYLDDGKLPKTQDAIVIVTSPLIEITVEGAVKKPGKYQVKKGTLVQEVLKLADPFDTANLKRIKLDSKITRRRTIRVHEKS